MSNWWCPEPKHGSIQNDIAEKKIRFEVKTFRLTWQNLLETQTEEFIIFQFCYERSKLWIEFITILLEYLNKKHSALHLQQFTTICSK